MTQLTPDWLESLSALRAVADPWDALWASTRSIPPTARAELLAQWVEHFGFSRRFQALVLRDGARLVAALPLVVRRKAGWLAVSDIPGNEWSPAGQLLLDPTYAVDALAARLLTEFQNRRVPMPWFASVNLEDPGWQAVANAARQRGWAVEVRPHCEVARIFTGGTWTAYESAWSANFRRQLHRAERRASAAGELTFQRWRGVRATELEAALRAGLQLEHRGWKGQAGTSVLAVPDLFELVRNQARQLARWNLLGLSFLNLNGRPIAFEYGWYGTDTYHSFKIGYDPQWAAVSPGQLLTGRLLRHCFAASRWQWFDFLGPVSPAIARWRPERQAVGRLLIAPPGLWNQVVLAGTRHLAPHLRRHAHAELT